jgi:hypothetical protein
VYIKGSTSPRPEEYFHSSETQFWINLAAKQMAQVSDVTRLTEKDNYLLWKMGVEALLHTHELFDRVGYDNKALGFIILTIDPKLAFTIIGECRLRTIDCCALLKTLAEMFAEPGGKGLLG